MAATKTSRTLLASQALAAAASVNTAELNLSAAYGALATVKLTNGATAPTTPPVVKFYIGESTGTKRLYWQGYGDVVNGSVTDVVCEIPPSSMFLNVTVTNGATNAITVEAYAQELTAV